MSTPSQAQQIAGTGHAIPADNLKAGERADVVGSIFFAGSLPPPIHGQSLVNAAVIRAAREFAGHSNVIVADIGTGGPETGLKCHFTRIIRVARASLMLAKHGFRTNQRLYTVFESGLGIGYNIIIIGSARLLGYHIILHHHSSKHTLVRQWRFAILQRLAGRCCLHVVLSEQMAINLQTLYPKIVHTMVSHNACHVEANDIKIRHSLSSPRKLRVGMLSNLCTEKGLDVALQVATTCRDRGHDITFVFAGPPFGLNAEKMLSKARKTLGAYVEIIGAVVNESKTAFFNSIDVFLFPTRYRFEAQPMVILEAMSYGLPVITTNCGYVSELIGGAGIVLELDEKLPDTIVEHLEKCLKGQDLSISNSMAIRTRFEKLRGRGIVQLGDLLNALFGVNQVDKLGPAPSPKRSECDA